MSESTFENIAGARQPLRGALLLKAAAAFGLAASVVTVADSLVGRQVWPSAPTRLIGMRNETEEAAITFGGLGSTNTAWQSGFSKLVQRGETVYWDYSTDRVSMDEMAVLFNGAAPSLKRVHINGHSMGGPLGLEVVRRASLPELKLGHVILHCSPYKASDARLNTLAQGLKVFRYPAGPVYKGVVSFARCMLEDNLSVRKGIAKARFDATNGCSPRQWSSMELLRQGLNLGKHLKGYVPLIDQETRFSYCMPENPVNDKTVNVEKACVNWEADFIEPLRELSGHPIPFDVYRVPGAGHADVQKDCRYMAAQIAIQNGLSKGTQD